MCMWYWMRNAARAGAIVATGFLGFVLAASLWLILSKLWLKQEIPSVFGYSPVYVLSGSMEPFFFGRGYDYHSPSKPI